MMTNYQNFVQKLKSRWTKRLELMLTKADRYTKDPALRKAYLAGYSGGYWDGVTDVLQDEDEKNVVIQADV